MNAYRSILKKSQSELIVKKSKFIAHAAPCETEDDAKLFISEIKKKYHDATHNVYAYRIGYENEKSKSSDDREPSNTAGKPILDLLTVENICFTTIVVTRYFGGILLGSGGLKKAYATAAKEVLSKGPVVLKQPYVKKIIRLQYHQLGKMEYMIREKKYICQDQIYGEGVELSLYVPVDGQFEFNNLMNEAFQANIKIETNEKAIYCAYHNGKLYQFNY